MQGWVKCVAPEAPSCSMNECGLKDCRLGTGGLQVVAFNDGQVRSCRGGRADQGRPVVHLVHAHAQLVAQERRRRILNLAILVSRGVARWLSTCAPSGRDTLQGVAPARCELRGDWHKAG